MEPLIPVDDPDWIAYKDGDESFYLRAAGDAIRRYCGWHIWPSLTVTVPKLRVGSGGIIMLPSLYVTDVDDVQVGDSVLDPADYMWFQEGYVQVPVAAAWTGGYYGYLPGGYLPGANVGRYAEVTMTSGYAEVPAEIKQVVFELVNSVSDVPAGNVKEIETPGFRLELSGFSGLNLNEAQMGRLAAFKLSWTR